MLRRSQFGKVNVFFDQLKSTLKGKLQQENMPGDTDNNNDKDDMEEDKDVDLFFSATVVVLLLRQTRIVLVKCPVRIARIVSI